MFYQNIIFSPELKSRSAYINIIRDPVARFEAFYYFSRHGNELGGGGKAKLSEERKLESVDDCVAKKRPECKNPWWQVVPYICGHHPKCNTRSQEAVDIAKVSLIYCSFKTKT